MSFEHDVDMQEVYEFWSARDMFPPRSSDVDPDGNLMVAIYSRRRLVERLRERVAQYPDNEEFQESLNINQARLENGEETYVCEDDYFYDVIDNVNCIARYDHAESPETTLVVGQRIMTWDEFRRTTTRTVPETFAEFQHWR